MNSKDSGKKILFITPYPYGISPGQRFRFEHYFSRLNQEGYQITQQPFINSGDYPAFFSTTAIRKAFIVLKGYIRRFGLLFRLHSFDMVFVYRETSPLGPPFIAWFNHLITRKPLIYDFDDAIWLRDEGGEPAWLAGIKWKRKVRTLCSLADKVLVGNEFLASYSRKFNPNTQIIPTVVDTDNYHRRNKTHGEELIIGWTGTHSTLPYLEPIIPVLRKLRESYSFTFQIIANKNPDFEDAFIEFIPWNKETEIHDLQQIHIGIMPLENTSWSKGKCGFKAIQYLSLEIPAVVSRVGVNAEIVLNNENGFIAETPEEWYEKLSTLMADEKLRSTFGSAGRDYICKKYSVRATEKMFVKALDLEL